LSNFSDDFSGDTGSWEYLGFAEPNRWGAGAEYNAYRDTAEEYVVLTPNDYDLAGALWFEQDFTSSFTASFRYLAGGGEGADGLVMMFYHEKPPFLWSGGCLSFIGAGYGIELDNYPNYGDPAWDGGPLVSDPTSNPHIALIKDDPSNHLAYSEDLRIIGDSVWHSVSVVVDWSSITVYMDSHEVLRWTGSIDRTHAGLGFVGTTGTYTNQHLIDDFSLENYVEGETGRTRPNTAAQLAIASIGADYLWGGKGYDLNQATFVTAQKVVIGPYTYWNPCKYSDPCRGAKDSGSGLDCSGLVFWAYNRAYFGDKSLTASEYSNRPLYYEGANGQYQGNTATVRPSKDQLLPGDLLFFDTVADGVTLMDHVAMYVGPFTYGGATYNVVHASGFTMTITPAVFDPSTERLITTKSAGQTQSLKVTDYGRVVDYRKAGQIAGKSPIDLIVTDPDGVAITRGQEVPGMSYMEYDLDGDSDVDDVVVLIDLKPGDYSIAVVPEPDVLPDETFTLEYLERDEVIVLADAVEVGDAPIAPYIVRSNGSQLVPWVGPITTQVDPVPINTAVNATACFTGPGAHTAMWDWGDGISLAGLVSEANGTGTVAGSHTYIAAGIYTVKLTVTDDDGAFGDSISQYVVVYDPSAGFVTGGGWIDSPEGAYAADPSLTGKANFGFVAKYQKGKSEPTGQTQFQFHVAGLDFKSTSYQWLVISGAKAKYKGWGTINGSGDYGFMLSAVDGQISGGGGVDKFRIKIWDKATGEVVYDNQMGDSDDATAATALGGGSIVIHATKSVATAGVSSIPYLGYILAGLLGCFVIASGLVTFFMWGRPLPTRG
jgi:cell wall-associated NlpC family hydrolase/PKD repeat protein